MLLVDTSFLVVLERELGAGSAGPARAFLHANSREKLAISIITVGEYLEGVDDVAAALADLSRFTIVGLHLDTARKCAEMQSRMPQRLGENDAWIAATALAHDFRLVDRDAAFGRVSRLRWVAI